MTSLADKECRWCGRLVAVPCTDAEQSAICEEPESTADLVYARPSRKERQPILLIRITAEKETA